MASYSAPGVYVKDVPSGAQSIRQLSSSVGMLIGKTRSGKVGVPQLVTSWTDFINKYANGLDTPFMENDYLAYSVYGFFNNGGTQLYVGSVKKNGVKATFTQETGNKITATASTEGVWGNSIKIKIEKTSDWTEGSYEAVNVTVSVGTSDSVTVTDVTLEKWDSIMENSKVKAWLSVLSLGTGVTQIAEGTITLANGSDGTVLGNSDYADALTMADTILDELTFIAIPGQTNSVVNLAVINYAENNQLFPFIDMPLGSEVADVKTYRRGISTWTGALCYPWGKVNDPLTDNLKLVPTAGHMMGLYARTIEDRGIHKAAAGTSAQVRGFVEMETPIAQSELGILNVAGVIVIMSRPNAGIVAWGARSLNSSDSTMKYVTDGIINLNIKKSIYVGTQYAVFEPNDDKLWANLRATCKGFLETLRKDGTLKGDSPEEAYYVICDETNNTEDTIAEGQCIIDIGYAPVKPAEFIIFRIAHSMATAE